MKIPVRFRKPEPEPKEPGSALEVYSGDMLRVADRCDRCGAQAFASAIVKGVELLFCGHHFRKHETALRKVAERVRDERHRINAKPSGAAY